MQRAGQRHPPYVFMGSFGLLIGGGTTNMQRNMIAERGLGLPR